MTKYLSWTSGGQDPSMAGLTAGKVSEYCDVVVVVVVVVVAVPVVLVVRVVVLVLLFEFASTDSVKTAVIITTRSNEASST
ncbi:MAG: hypothetical protein NZ733_02480 [Aigarchaeota archaeon]|nr:hypothetical protein [Aigarchaeota archaeon]